MTAPDIREKAERITQAELVAMFGDLMPNDAAEILINTDVSVPISEVRQRLSASAERWKVRKRVVALWEETVENSAHLWAGDTARDLLVEADGQPERYDVFASMVADAFQAALLEAHNAGRAEMKEEALKAELEAVRAHLGNNLDQAVSDLHRKIATAIHSIT